MPRNPSARKIVVTLLASGLMVSLGAPTAGAQSPARQGYDGTDVISTLPEFGSRGTGGAPPQRGVQREGGVNGTVGGTLGAFDAGDPSTPTATRRESGDAGSGSLPFTGFEGGLVALMGLALVATGFALRRAGSSRP